MKTMTTDDWVFISNIDKGAYEHELKKIHEHAGVSQHYRWGDPQGDLTDSQKKFFVGLFRHKDYNPHAKD